MDNFYSTLGHEEGTVATTNQTGTAAAAAVRCLPVQAASDCAVDAAAPNQRCVVVDAVGSVFPPPLASFMLSPGAGSTTQDDDEGPLPRPIIRDRSI